MSSSEKYLRFVNQGLSSLLELKAKTYSIKSLRYDRLGKISIASIVRLNLL